MAVVAEVTLHLLSSTAGFLIGLFIYQRILKGKGWID